jgi:prolyl-tRNA synthetase
MRYSHLFSKVKKDPPADETSKGARLLVQAGYVQKELAGAYAYLPLGRRVLDKITEIIREEMENIGGQEVLLSALQNPEPWKETNRWSDEAIDVWFKTNLKNGTEIGLGTTHEEPLTMLMKQHIFSYKDLPRYVFQFQTKFRNELRARSGILRTREFIMKDLYSFSKDHPSHEEFYEKAKQAYFNIFERVGLGDHTFITFASGGAFSKYSHEFQTLCAVGEDTIYLDREKGLAVNQEVLTEQVLSDLGLKRDSLEELNAIEVGNIFSLGTRYSESLNLTYTDENGKEIPVVMGCYGMSPGRSMGTVAEIYADEKGLVWPKSIAPFQVHLLSLNAEEPQVKERAENVYKKLKNNGIEVLFDDREGVSAGEKLQTADLLGIPYRVIVSKKTGDLVELKQRTSDETHLNTIDKIISQIQ